MVEARDAENAGLRAELAAALERERRLELRVAELERLLGMDSTNSGADLEGAHRGRGNAPRQSGRSASPRSASAARTAGVAAARHPGSGPARSGPGPAQGRGFAGAVLAVRDRLGWRGERGRVVGAVLGRDDRQAHDGLAAAALECPCCGQVTVADATPGLHPGTICYGPGVNAAAVPLSGYRNVPAERAANLICMLLGVPVSPGFVAKARARLDGKLKDAGFDGPSTQCQALGPPPK